MNFFHFNVNMFNCQHNIQLGPDDSMSFPAIYGADNVHCSCSLDLFICDIKKKKMLAKMCFMVLEI